NHVLHRSLGQCPRIQVFQKPRLPFRQVNRGRRVPLTSRSSRKDWTTIPQGDRSLLLAFGEGIDVSIGRRCAAAANALRTAALNGVTDIIPSFNSVAVLFQPTLGHDAAS